jgi:hypothetical protein
MALARRLIEAAARRALFNFKIFTFILTFNSMEGL